MNSKQILAQQYNIEEEIIEQCLIYTSKKTNIDPQKVLDIVALDKVSNRQYFMILVVYDTSLVDTNKLTLGKPSFGGNYNDMEYEYPLVIASAVSNTEEGSKEILKEFTKLEELGEDDALGVEEVFPMKRHHIKKLFKEGKTGIVSHDRTEYLLHGEYVDKPQKYIYVMFIYSEQGWNYPIDMHYIKYFNTEKEFIEWIGKGNLAEHIDEVENLKKTKEYNIPDYGKITYKKLASKIVKDFKTTQVSIITIEEDVNTYFIHLTKVSVQDGTLLEKRI